MSRIALTVALAGLLGVLFATPADARPPDRDTYQVIVQWDAGVKGIPKSGVDWWEYGTNLNLVQGSCSGALCIHVHAWAGQLYCNDASVGCSGMPGAVEDVHYGTCDIWLNTERLAGFSRGARAQTLAHETGHCLGLPHLGDPYAVMYYSPPMYTPFTGIQPADRVAVNALWP